MTPARAECWRIILVAQVLRNGIIRMWEDKGSEAHPSAFMTVTKVRYQAEWLHREPSGPTTHNPFSALVLRS